MLKYHHQAGGAGEQDRRRGFETINRFAGAFLLLLDPSGKGEASLSNCLTLFKTRVLAPCTSDEGRMFGC